MEGTEIKFLAARRIGELVPDKEIGGRGKPSELRTVSDIPRQRLSEFRKLAEIPISRKGRPWLMNERRLS